MIAFLPFVALLAPVQASAPAKPPVPVASRIVEVTVYPGSAAVRRSAQVPLNAGALTLSGLPRSLDPDALRVRATGAEIVGVELRERVAAGASDERIEELRAKVADCERRIAANADERAVVETMTEHTRGLITAEPPKATGGAPSLERWKEGLAYLESRLTDLAEQRRGIEARGLELQRELADLRLELGRSDAGAGVRTYDLVVDAFGLGGATTAELEVDYVVPSAGWSPVYDLRAPKDLASVELSYRARVSQQTGEDWSDVALYLSTAEPRRGAQGPEPETRWVGLYDPRVASGAIAAPAEDKRERSYGGRLATVNKALEPAPFATVEDEGLSLRYALPSRETVESRSEPTTVLVGRAKLAVEPEHYCIPAVDETVWVRGEARNTSDFVLLPGRAAVYLGADFLGHAELELVRRDESFRMPLGRDPGVTVKRTQLADESGSSGLFGSKRRATDTWRVELQNHGAFTRATDGAVDVIVHESLPRPNSDRIEVELKDVKPRLADGGRWKKLREEKGALTWIVRVPKGGATTIEHTVVVTWPEDESIVRRVER